MVMRGCLATVHVLIRMLGGVEAGGENPPATRLGVSLLNMTSVLPMAGDEICIHFKHLLYPVTSILGFTASALI